MGVAGKLTSRHGKFHYEMNEDAKYIDTKQLYQLFNDQVCIVKVMYVSNKGKYGPSGVIGVVDPYGLDRWINTPKHIVKDIETLRADADTYTQADNNQLGVKAYQYDLNGDIHYSLSFVDIE